MFVHLCPPPTVSRAVVRLFPDVGILMTGAGIAVTIVTVGTVIERGEEIIVC